MTAEWDPDNFFADDNWEKVPDRHVVEHRETLKKEAEKQAEIRGKEEKQAEKLLVLTFGLGEPRLFDVAAAGLEEKIRKTIGRNGGDGTTSKITIFKQAKTYNLGGKVIQIPNGKKSIKIIIDPFPWAARIHVIDDLSRVLEGIFDLASTKVRDSFVYIRVMTREECEINF